MSNGTSPAQFINLQPVPALIGGEPLTSSKTLFDVVRPERGDSAKVHSVVSCSVDDANRAVDAAAKALPSWKSTSFPERRAIFLKAADLLRGRIDEYVKLTTDETCLDLSFSGFELAHLAVPGLEETAAVISTALRGEFPRLDGSGRRELIQREPFGVVLGIAPWNAPFFLALRAILNPLAAGNTCILKTSENSPRTHLAVAQLLYDAGLPKGVLSVVHSAPQDVVEVTNALIHHPAVRKINFTGSTRVGRLIAMEAAKAIKPIVLELGGKAPQIVLDDADIKVAANNAVIGAMMNHGQICMSTAIILVDAKIEKSFLEEVQRLFSENKEALAEYRKAPGKARALFTAASAKRANEILESTLQAGAKIAAGDSSANDVEHASVKPVVVSGVKPEMRLFQEEAFAPILSVTTFTSDDEAVRLANSNSAGLAAAVYGSEVRAVRLAQQIEAGQVHVNAITVHDHPSIPHGGWKESGFGRFNGVAGLHEFTQTRTITMSEPQAMPLVVL
ncbi:aldehyde dehydrogenase [Jaminaea rosea]|uniref:Aldehyde dehydrogenase n=1 Tax=Jaminaea rosea TaxID=1569628 RepID=A0A316ULH8_9BASI|nr:aldehyde dehydrogenase [Jaminaea rosea]PWN26099.1 aldehyde dehydrogenase [Jaminaea rosea]